MTGDKCRGPEGGPCSCPFTGICFECKKPCKDHDLAADTYWCAECLERSFQVYRKEQGR